MSNSITSVVLCINPQDPQHPHVQARGNKFCTVCGAAIALVKRYIPLQKLGHGGFATIYTVWDLQTQTERVLKVLLETSPKARELFKQEAEILQSLRYPSVPIVEPDGYFQLSISTSKPPLPCLVMEKINGQTLEKILENYPQGCPEPMVSDWFQQALDILKVLHKRQIIHRDLKPANLMLRQGTNQLVLIDFGGAKKMRSPLLWSKDSSTRLYSPGYSPPEQSQGLDVEPAADFYALGRTMIQLLTGKTPTQLADPLTGELRWRNLVRVSQGFADLLDELVKEDVRKRPNAAKIKQRLGQNAAQPIKQSPPAANPPTQTKRRVASPNWMQNFVKPNRITPPSGKRSPQVSNWTNPLAKTNSLLKLIAQLGKAVLTTARAMVYSAIASCVGTATGFVLAYWSPLGDTVASFLWQQMPQLILNSQIAVEAEIIVFASVGLATAWGLTVAGGFVQRQNYLSPLIGLCGYILGWLFWLATPDNIWGIVGMIVVAVAILTLGLGLRSRNRVHAVVTSVGTASVFFTLVSLNLFPSVIFHLRSQPSWTDFWVYIAFFSFVSVTLSLWLSISYYLIVPCLRWLGWR